MDDDDDRVDSPPNHPRSTTLFDRTNAIAMANVKYIVAVRHWEILSVLRVGMKLNTGLVVAGDVMGRCAGLVPSNWGELWPGCPARTLLGNIGRKPMPE